MVADVKTHARFRGAMVSIAWASRAVGANSRGAPARRSALAAALFVLAASFALVAFAGMTACSPDTPPPRAKAILPGAYADSNVVIVSIDTLRADHLGVYGYSRDTSPRLDQLAKEAIVFERARAPRGLTWPSLVSLFTSLYPKSSNVRRNGDLLPDDVPTLASVLEARGYATAAFLGNACGVLTQNFDTNFCGTDEEVHRKAVEWIASAPEEPYLLWVHYKAPHEEYLPPKRFDRFTDPNYAGPAHGHRSYLDEVILSKKAPTDEDREHIVGLYDGEVLYSDAMMGEIIDALDRRGDFDETIFVFTSDHGEELLQHNNYYYHSCSVYDAVLHVPLVIRLPDRNHAGRRIASLVENIDVAPSLLEMLGVDSPAGVEGQTLLPLVNDVPGAPERFTRAFAEYHRPGTGWIGTVRTDRWHYIHNPDDITTVCRPQSDYFDVRERELYDHSRDAGEQLDVAIEHEALVDELAQEVMEAFDRQRDHAPPQRADPQVIEQLKAMGYLVE